MLDSKIWERDFTESVQQLVSYYKSVKGSVLGEHITKLLERQHPWLISGEVPHIDGSGGNGLTSSKEFRRAVVLGAVGFGMAAAHFWKWPS